LLPLSHITCYDSITAAILDRKAFYSLVNNFVVMLVKLSLVKMQIAELENIQTTQRILKYTMNLWTT